MYAKIQELMTYSTLITYTQNAIFLNAVFQNPNGHHDQNLIAPPNAILSAQDRYDRLIKIYETCGRRVPSWMYAPLPQSVEFLKKQYRASTIPAIKADIDERANEGRVAENEVISTPTSTYQIQLVIGRGTFGEVVRALDVNRNEVVAIKVFKERQHEIHSSELEMMQKLASLNAEECNIVRAYESFESVDNLCIVFEMLDMSLLEYIERRNYQCLPLHWIRPIVQQVLKALQTLQLHGIIHTDLKLENIMLVNSADQPFRIKLIDFGCAIHRDVVVERMNCQTLHYRSPEVLLALHFNEAIDIWSLGCIMAELFLAWPLYPGTDNLQMLQFITELQGMLPEALIRQSVVAKKYFTFEEGSYRVRCGTPSVPNQKTRKDDRKFKFDQLNNIAVMNDFGHCNDADVSCDRLDRAEFCTLLTSMLELEHEKRIKPSDALQHPFITLSHLSTDGNNCPQYSQYSIVSEYAMQVCTKREHFLWKAKGNFIVNSNTPRGLSS